MPILWKNNEKNLGDYRRNSPKNDLSIKDIETNNIIEKKSPVRNAWGDVADSIVGTFEMLQSFKRVASYVFSSVGGTIITKIP